MQPTKQCSYSEAHSKDNVKHHETTAVDVIMSHCISLTLLVSEYVPGRSQIKIPVNMFRILQGWGQRLKVTHPMLKLLRGPVGKL